VGDNGHLLVVRGLSKHFMGLRAVDGVDLDVTTGKVHAVIGPNGAGKSTLFNLVSGRIRPDSGTVVFDGTDVTGAAPNRLAHIGMGRGFQTTAVFPKLTVEENVRLALMGIHGDTRRPFGSARKLYREQVRETMVSVGLEERSETPARELSHGHQRALELGMSLALGARLLLLDEPTAGMSPYETRRTLELLRQVIESRDVTLLITEHDMEVVFGIAQTVTVMAEGHVLTEGSPDEVRSHPDVIRVYLGVET
jgi:branched-chain amino acid transport system ATP-binding protein